MSEHPNVDLLRRGFGAFAVGDLVTLDGIFADDATWHIDGRNRFSGDYEGKAAFTRFFLEYFGELTNETDTFGQEVHALFADDEHGVALTKLTVTRGDDRLESDNVMVFLFDDGLVTEVWLSAFDPYVEDEFWA